MENLDIRMNVLDSSSAAEVKLRFEALGIHLEGEALEKKTLDYVEAIARYVSQGHQYFGAQELAWESVT